MKASELKTHNMKTMNLLLLTLPLVSLILGVNADKEWEKGELMDPRGDNYESCKLESRSWICDPDNVLQSAEFKQLNSTLNDFPKDTKCPCSAEACRQNDDGYQVAVAIIKKMKLDKENDGDAETIVRRNLNKAEHFVEDLRDRWEIGRCQEGVIILYSVNDNMLYSLTDGVSRRVLTDALLGSIAMDKRVEFLQSGVFEGLRQVILEYKNVFNGKYSSQVGVPGDGKPGDTQAVVGGAPLTLTSLAMLLCAALAASLMLC